MALKINVPEFFETLPLFSALSFQQRSELFSWCFVQEHEKGDILFIEGDNASGFYFVISGKIKIYRMSLDGREAILHVFGTGKAFGEAAVFQGGGFPASAQCVVAGQTLFLPRSALMQCIKTDPTLAMSLLGSLSQRLHEFASKIEALTLMETPQRLAAYLLHMASDKGANPVVSLDVSKSLLAGMLGTARETLSRSLGRFVDDGAIAVVGRSVKILNKRYLEAMVKGVGSL